MTAALISGAMDILIIIMIAAATSFILYSGIKGNQNQSHIQLSSHLPWRQIGLCVVSQTTIMILIVVFRGMGKSLSNLAFLALIVAVIIVIGTIVSLSLHHRRAGITSWVLLFSVASSKCVDLGNYKHTARVK